MGDTQREEWVNMSTETDILRWCSSLVRRTADGIGLEIAHFTVREFLENDRLLGIPLLARYHYSKPEAASNLAMTCLTYLNFNDFGQTTPEAFIKVTEYPFWKHAALHWDDYYSTLESPGPDLLLLAQQLFNPVPTPQFVTWNHWVAMEEPLFHLKDTNFRKDQMLSEETRLRSYHWLRCIRDQPLHSIGQRA